MIGSSMSLIEYQRTILADPVRNRAFADALAKVIVPGKTTVADIGAGTGYLSFLARKLGAKECHLYEVSELSTLSRSIAKENAITGCHFHHVHSMDVTHPPKVDLVVSETFGNFALEESIIGNLNDARRFLKPGGAVMPCSLKQFVCPVISDRIQGTIDTWSAIDGKLQWSSARETSLNNMYVKEILPDDLLADSIREWDFIDFAKHNKEIRKSTITWSITPSATSNQQRKLENSNTRNSKLVTRNLQTASSNQECATIHGFSLWWESTLVPNVMLSTSPYSPPTHWQQIYLPLLEPLPLRPKETLELELSVDSRYDVRINVAWKTTVKDAEGKTVKALSQDMRRGFLA